MDSEYFKNFSDKNVLFRDYDRKKKVLYKYKRIYSH